MTSKRATQALDVIDEQLHVVRLELGLYGGTDRQVKDIADQFARMDDDHQAKFFVEVARLFAAWGGGKSEWQIQEIGQHLRTCECSTQEARDWIASLAISTADKLAEKGGAR